MFIILHFGLYCLIVIITERLKKFLIHEFSEFRTTKFLPKPPIKTGWFCPESIAGVRCVQLSNDVKTYIERALKNSLVARHTLIMAPYVEK